MKTYLSRYINPVLSFTSLETDGKGVSKTETPHSFSTWLITSSGNPADSQFGIFRPEQKRLGLNQVLELVTEGLKFSVLCTVCSFFEKTYYSDFWLYFSNFQSINLCGCSSDSEMCFFMTTCRHMYTTQLSHCPCHLPLSLSPSLSTPTPFQESLSEITLNS